MVQPRSVNVKRISFYAGSILFKLDCKVGNWKFLYVGHEKGAADRIGGKVKR